MSLQFFLVSMHLHTYFWTCKHCGTMNKNGWETFCLRSPYIIFEHLPSISTLRYGRRHSLFSHEIWWISLFKVSLVAQRLKHLPPMRETRVWSLSREDPLEKEMAIHSSILAWRIPWTEKPSRLQSTGSQRVGHNWATSPSLFKGIQSWMTPDYWYELYVTCLQQ